MSYLIKYTGTGVEKPVQPNKFVYWKNGETRWVQNEVYANHYATNLDVFTVLQGAELSPLEYPGGMAVASIDFNAAGESAMTVTIGGIVYTEADTAVPATGVFTNGASAAASATSLIAAINGDTRTTVPFTALVDVSGDGVFIYYDTIGVAGNMAITTTSASNCTVTATATGGAAVAAKQITGIVHTVTTQALLSGAVEIPVPFAPVTVVANAYSATGAPILMTDLVTVETAPNRITITTTGGTNLANTDVVHLVLID